MKEEKALEFFQKGYNCAQIVLGAFSADAGLELSVRFSEAHIRPVTPEDLPGVAEMIRAAFATVAEEFDITEQNGPRHTSFITAEKLQTHFARGWMMAGLYEGDRLVGYVSLSEEGGGVFELHNLAVRPECRHKGYGKRLLDLCKEKVKELGGQKITLSHIEENTVLKNWYGANGFVHTGTRQFDFLPFTSGYMEWYVIK